MIIQLGIVPAITGLVDNSIREGAPIRCTSHYSSEPPRTPNSNIDGTYNSTTTGRIALRLRLSTGCGLITPYLQARPVWSRRSGCSRGGPSRTSTLVARLSVGLSENQHRILLSSCNRAAWNISSLGTLFLLWALFPCFLIHFGLTDFSGQSQQTNPSTIGMMGYGANPLSGSGTLAWLYANGNPTTYCSTCFRNLRAVSCLSLKCREMALGSRAYLHLLLMQINTP